jgi:O-antigen ligase
MKTAKKFGIRYNLSGLSELFSSFKGLFKDKDVLFIICLVSLLAASFLMTGFNRFPYTLIFNGILVIFCLCALIILFKNQAFKFDKFFVFFCIYFFVILVNSLINKSFFLTPFANCFIGFFVYELAASSSRKKNDLLVFNFFLGLFFFSILVFCYYLPSLMKGSLDGRIGDLFGSADGMGAILSLLVFFCFYYLAKGYSFSVIPMILAFFLIILSQTRTAFANVVVAFVPFLYFLLRDKKRYVFWISLVVIVCLFFGALQLPLFSSIKNRFLKMIQEYLGIGTDESASERLELIKRSWSFAFSHPLYGYGYNGILRYSFQAAHDLLGDLSLYYGGIFALLTLAFFSAVNFSFFKNKGPYALLLICSALFFFFNFFLGIVFSSRLISTYFSFVIGLSRSDQGLTIERKPSARPVNVWYLNI